MMNMLIVVVEMRKREKEQQQTQRTRRKMFKKVSRKLKRNDYDLAESKASSSISTTWAKVGLRAGSCAQQAHMTAA